MLQGLLQSYYEDIIKLYNREKSHVYQEYCLLVATLMESYSR